MKILIKALLWVIIPVLCLLAYIFGIIVISKVVPFGLLTLILGFLVSGIFFGLSYIKYFKWIKYPAILGQVLSLGLLVVIFSEKMDSNVLPKPVPEGQKLAYWDLPTGSHLGYVKFSPKESNNEPPILFVHGGPGVNTIFGFNLAKLLADKGYTVYTFDQAGGGYSSNIPAKEYSMDRSIADIEAIRQAINAPKITLIGHSFGGPLTTAYLAKHSDHAAAAILLAPAGYTSELFPGNGNLTDCQDGIPGAPTFKRHSIRMYTPVILNNLGAGPELVEYIASQDQLKAFVQQNLFGEGMLGSMYCEGKTPAPPAMMKNFTMNLIANTRLSVSYRNYVNPDVLDNIPTPALVLRGECDYIEEGYAKQYAERMPNAKYVALPGYGHDLMRDGLPLEEMVEFLGTVNK